MGFSVSIVVTVGFCVKDMADIVGGALQSVIDQDFSHASLELAVVEGFSGDETYSIVKNHLAKADFDYKIYRDNRGLGAARQMVVDKARGKYIVWVDGDMILPSNYIRNQVAFMEGNPSVAVGGGSYGLHVGYGMAADLENLVYAVDSVYGRRTASKFGYLPGTEGSIFRVEAIRKVGGFDVGIKGAAEDTELASRLISEGWAFSGTGQYFKESTRSSLFSLWRQYIWYGYGGHFIFHKNTNMLTLWKMSPFAGFVAGLVRTSAAYRLVHKHFVFFLPFHYAFKRTAWFLGFFSAHVKGYGHTAR